MAKTKPYDLSHRPQVTGLTREEVQDMIDKAKKELRDEFMKELKNLEVKLNKVDAVGSNMARIEMELKRHTTIIGGK